MRALITRPEEDATPLAEALKAKNVDVAIEPLLTIRILDEAAIDLDGVQALLFTSANGVRAFAARSERRDIGVLTVGEASAGAARAAGFTHVESAGGDVDDLVRLVQARLDPNAGALFHAAGSVVAGDLAGRLGEAGYDLRRVMLYEAKPADALSPGVLAGFAARGFDLVLFFSPRTAATFVELLRKSDDPRAVDGCGAATALCLSPAAAAAAESLPWKAVKSAEKPDLPSMLRLVDDALAPQDHATAAAEPGAAEPAAAERAPVAASRIPPAAPAAPRSGSAGAVIAAAVVAALITVAGIATEPMWRPYLAGVLPAPETTATPAPVADPAVGQRLDALDSTTTTLSQRLAALDGALQQLDARDAGAGSDMADFGARLDALSGEAASLRQELDRLSARPAAGAAPAAIPDDIAALPGQVAALRQRLDEAAAKDASPETRAALDALRQQVDALDTASHGFDAWMSGVESRLAEIDALGQRMTALEQATSVAESRATSTATLALALNQLQAALTSRRPFAVELAALRDLAASDPEAAAQIRAATDSLVDRAATGVPTLVELREAFPATARAIVAAARAQGAAEMVGETTSADGAAPAGDTADWLDSAMLKLSELVSVRPVGEDVEGDDAAARAARAEARLGKGDLAGAVTELDGLSGQAAAAAQGWLADARGRLDAETAIGSLQSLAVGRLAPANGDG